MVSPHLRTDFDAKFSPRRLIFSIWCSVGLANGALSLLGPNGLPETLRVISTSLCGLILSIALSFATQKVIERSQPRRWLMLGALVLLGGTSLWAIDATLQIQSFSRLSLHWPSLRDFIDRRFNVVYFNLIFTLQTAAQALLISNRTLRARDHQLAESRLSAQHAQLAALRFQLNPHFLFNSLNAISTLAAEAGAKDAEEMIDRLADFLRASLSSEPQEFITLERELETVQAYLDIEFVRFGERMNVCYVCSSELSLALVPSLILQPLVENAVKYAVAPSREMVTITVSARQVASELFLEIADDAKTNASENDSPWSTGLGLKNVANRLKVLYQDRADLNLIDSSSGFTAVIRLPLERSLPSTEAG
jgi:sensor histidine kinase YesM